MTDNYDRKYTDLNYSKDKISTYLEQVLSAVAVDWLTKVDRCVGGKVKQQQTAGEFVISVGINLEEGLPLLGLCQPLY
jgi:hypothetical protein